jgi:signal transduction histidine kinase
MVTAIGGLLRAQRDFVADASHELRTPLAALRLRLENLERDIADEARPGLDSALAEVERLSVLVDALLALARADAGQAAPEAVRLRALVEVRLEAWAAAAADRGVAIELADGPAVVARATPGAIAQVVDNLLSNALTVAPPGSVIAVACRAAGNRALLTVDDAGPGLSPADRERAFGRFWRAAVEHGPGSGLGLAIVRRLVEADGGEVGLEESPAGGLRAVVTLPLDV